VSESSQIDWGKFDGFSWIRCSGKGNFMSSPAVKQCAERCLQEGERCMVIDLHLCTGMDSTFMGMLAGLAMRLTKQTGGGRLEIAGASEKNVVSLEDLGLNALMEINPGSAPWLATVESIRVQLQPWTGASLNARERSKEVLEAHKILSSANEENAGKFENVVQLLEKELGTTPS
jgi:anti-anti-sigma regulatory factor